MSGFITPLFTKVGMTGKVFSVDALPGFRPSHIVPSPETGFPPSSYVLNCYHSRCIPSLIDVLMAAKSCSFPRSDEFGLSKTPTKEDNPPRSSASSCHVSISIQMTHFPASTAQSTMHPLPSLMRIQNMTGDPISPGFS